MNALAQNMLAKQTRLRPAAYGSLRPVTERYAITAHDVRVPAGRLADRELWQRACEPFGGTVHSVQITGVRPGLGGHYDADLELVLTHVPKPGVGAIFGIIMLAGSVLAGLGIMAYASVKGSAAINNMLGTLTRAVHATFVYAMPVLAGSLSFWVGKKAGGYGLGIGAGALVGFVAWRAFDHARTKVKDEISEAPHSDSN